MACYHPVQAYQYITHDGKKRLNFRKKEGEPITLPCGGCIGCRMDRSQQWAIRQMHEAQLHEENTFITLTYDDNHLPQHGSLNIADFQKFMKRLREHYEPKKIRFFHCGEYGEKLQRPHYHACLFGHDFEDKYPWRESRGNTLYRSPTLEKLWPFGMCEIGELNYKSAAYVARYVMKKVTGKGAEEHYEYLDETTGALYNIQPEYATMSRKPGLGQDWYNQYKRDLYPDDFVVINGRQAKIPRYYDKLFEREHPEEMKEIKKRREQFAKEHEYDNTPERLKSREICHGAKITRLKRNLEEQ
jgi:hypothetical protein